MPKRFTVKEIVGRLYLSFDDINLLYIYYTMLFVCAMLNSSGL